MKRSGGKRRVLKTRDDLIECICLECGISHYIEQKMISEEDRDISGRSVIDSIFCSRCGGKLMVNCRAGEEPFYRLK